MNKYQEAYDRILTATNNGDGLVAELNTIKELVDKTVPVTPLKEIIEFGPKGKFTSYIKIAHCPKCSNRVLTCDRVCGQCGQVLDWSKYE